MNILQILPELNYGGVETGTLDLARYLVNAGHKAVVVSSGGTMVKGLQDCGAIHYQLPVGKKSLFTMIKAVPELARIIEKEKIDIVHARSRVPAWIAYFACRLANIPLVTTCHGYYKKHPLSYVMGYAKRVIALSNVLARHMIEDFGVPYERIRLIPRSVDLEKFKYTPPQEKKKGDFNVGIIARITPIKGHLYFIKAMAKAARVIPELKIWIVGDAPVSKEAYKEQVQILIKRLGLEQRTQFLGAQRQIPEILSHLDVVVLATTTHEGFGRVIIEAQACGVNVVATRVGGVVDVVEDEKTGLLVAPGEPSEMAEAVVRLYKDRALCRLLAENAYLKVKENYSLKLMAERTLEVYRQALSDFKILIIKFSSLGDIILSTAAIRAIREKYSSCGKISFLVAEEYRDALMNCPYIDELIVCDFKNRDKGVGGFLKLCRLLRKKGFDTVIDLQNNRRSHLISFLTFAAQSYGYNNKKFGFLLKHAVKNDSPGLEPVEHQFRILKMLGIELKDRRLELWPTQEDRRYIEEFLSSQWLSQNQILVGMNISASKKWLTKNWPLRHMVKLCAELAGRKIQVVLTGTDKDLETARKITEELKDVKIINACAKTSVNQLACLIKKCSVYICADSAPLHIAASQSVPFVALFGPTDPRRHLPAAQNYVLLKKDLACSPCYKPECKTKECMEKITVAEVLEAVERLLSNHA